eukprot:113186-Amphidinium_carterae.1
MWRRAAHGGLLLGSRAPNGPEVSIKVNSEHQAASEVDSHVAGMSSQGDPTTEQAAGRRSRSYSPVFFSALTSEVDAGERAMCNFEVSFVRLLNTHKGKGHRKRSQAASLQRRSRRQEKRASSTHSAEHLRPLEPDVTGEDDSSEGFVDAISSQASASACLEYIELH